MPVIQWMRNERLLSIAVYLCGNAVEMRFTVRAERASVWNPACESCACIAVAPDSQSIGFARPV